jgi:hypothetical protein
MQLLQVFVVSHSVQFDMAQATQALLKRVVAVVQVEQTLAEPQ